MASSLGITMKRIRLGLLLLALPVCLRGVSETRGLHQRRSDVVDARARTELGALLRDVEQQTTAEIALVTVPSLDGMTVEEHANRLFKEWGIGRRARQ